jgi:tetratricopeptide (TPR) repeat protein
MARLSVTIFPIILALSFTSSVVRAEPVDSLLAQAEQLLTSGEYESALHIYGQIIENDSTDAMALYKRGLALKNLGRNEEAAADFEKTLDLDRQNAEAAYYLASTLDALGKSEAAIDAYYYLVDSIPEADKRVVEGAVRRLKVLLDSATAPPAPYERHDIALDRNSWQVGFTNTDASGTVVEYIPRTQTIDNWTELVATRFFSGLQKNTTVAMLYERYTKTAYENCKRSHLQTLIEGPKNIIYEWNNFGCTDTSETRPQYEIARIFESLYGLHRVSYACKDKAVFESVKEDWMIRLLNISVRED